ncbi:uncharacterized protein LOC144432389 [Styela clava]
MVANVSGLLILIQGLPSILRLTNFGPKKMERRQISTEKIILNKIVIMNNGIKASWTVGDMKWYPGYPSKNAGWTILAVHTGRDTGDPQRMHNFPKSRTRSHL